MNVQDFFAIPENAIAYKEWLKDPITQHVVSMVEHSLKPMGKPADVVAERYAGVMDGRFEAVRLFTTLDKVAELIEHMNEKLPAPDYGTRDLMKTNFGYTDEELDAYNKVQATPGEEDR